jgi:hypothetical protein
MVFPIPGHTSEDGIFDIRYQLINPIFGIGITRNRKYQYQIIIPVKTIFPILLFGSGISDSCQAVWHRGATLAYLAASSFFKTAGQLIRACMQVESRATSHACMV